MSFSTVEGVLPTSRRDFSMATATEDEDLFYYPPPLSSHLEYCSLVLDHGGSNNPAALLRMQNNNHHTTGTTSTRMGEPFSSSLYDSSSFLCANALKSSSFGGDGGSTFTLTPNISNKAFTIPILPTTTTTPTAQQALYYSHSQAGNHSTTTTTAWNSIGGGGRGSGSGDDPGAEEKRGEPSGMGPFLAHASSSPPFHHHHLLGFSSHSSLWTPPAPKTNHAPSNHTTRTLKPGAAAFSPTTPTSTTPSPISLWIEKEPLTAAFQCRPPPGMGGTGARWGDDPSPPPPVRSLQDLSAGGFCSPLTVATGLLPSPRSSPVWHSANQAVAAACTPSPYAFVPILESNTPDPFRREQDRGYCEVIAAARTNCVVSPYSDSCCGVDDANNNDDYKCNEDELMTMFSLNTSDHSNDCSSTAFRPFVDRDDTPLPPHFAAESPYWINAAAAKTPKSSLLEPNYKKFLAPSPTMTVETASVMTMDQSSVQSNSINNTIRTSSVRPCAKEFVAAPPLYPKPLQESSSYSSAQQQQPPAPMSSLAAAAWTGRACRTFVPSTPPTKNFYAASSSSSSSSLRNSADACVQPTSSLAAAAAAGGMRRHASSFATTTMTRPQSAPTVGRPTIVRTNSNNIIKGSLTTTTASTCTKEEDAQLRKTRLKTELCLHYMSGRPCPFGSNCTYAHGEEELQMTKLLDLHDAGLVDMETYRTKPCLTWITTGSCPFGKRCSGIHDYRVSNLASQSWLPHTETQGNTIATDINVDGLHQKRLHTILYDNPFGDQFKLMSEPGEENGGNTYDDLYGLVCRDATSLHGNFKKKDGWIAGSSNGLKRGRQVHSIYKLQIALKLRGTDPDWLYKYRPQHIVHDELCMVLQKRAFRVTSNDHLNQTSNKPNALRQSTSSTATSTSSVVEIALSEYNPRAVSNILVHEIAFGPDSDPSVRGLALWFNIADTDITVCTPQQAKRFRWKKTGNAQTSKRQVRSDQEENVTPDFTNNSKHSPSVFDSGFLDYFPMIRPHDDAAFRLTTEMMKHRLAYLKSERVVGMKERFDVLQKIQRQETWLKERFENQRRMWLQWAWPVNIGRAKVDYHTPVPPVEGPYELEAPSTMKTSVMGKTSDDSEVDHVTTDIRSHLGESVHRIWDTFVDTINENNPDFSNKLHDISHTNEQQPKNPKQLSVFEILANGQEIDQCRALPHIVKHRALKEKPGHRQQERCWMALLLTSDSRLERNEWDIVREHFENSRSKKVLSILQQ